jgi:hypothetical protein
VNILLTIFLAPIALFAGLIALGLFIRFFWLWVGIGLMVVLFPVGYMCWANADSAARMATIQARSKYSAAYKPEYQGACRYDGQGNLMKP